MNLKIQAKREVLEMKNNPPYILIHKKIGETPLEALRNYQNAHEELRGLPMTYAGRLDPMASGKLLILIGDECKNKDKYLGLNKEYEIEIVFGISTDTYDALGVVGLTTELAGRAGQWTYSKGIHSGNVTLENLEKIKNIANDFCNKCPITFEQEYPPFSSKTVSGIPLHVHSRQGSLPDEMPTKNVTIYSCELLGMVEISAQTLLSGIVRDVGMVHGDFRQKEILSHWKEVLENNLGTLLVDDFAHFTYPVMKLRVKCSSGTYMRSLAHRFGKETGLGAFALSIRRTKVGVV